MPSEKVRAYFYRVLLAVSPVIAFYGYMTNEELALWLGVASTVLNVLPVMNTSTKANDE
jgi:sorbitol-specific phosphotransferase system component IIC